MTQDQYGQTRGPGYVVRDDAVPDEENEEYAAGQSKPKTAFQKVASALRGDREDELAQQDEAAMANSPVSRASQRQGDYWDEPAASADRDEAVAVTSPDVAVPPGISGAETGTDPVTRQDHVTRQDQVTGQADPDAADHPATQPDMFGTTTHGGNGATSVPYPEDQAGEPATADVPANGAQANGPAASDLPAGDVPAGNVPAGNVPAGNVPAGEATGTAGRHAAAAPAGTESRPGEAAGAVGDFSDLTYGSLIADGDVYIEQWQQVQFKFVDDPRASVTEAADIIAQVTARLEAAIQERQRAIEERQRAIAEQQRSLRDRWGEGTNADTEGLRETLRMYRTFLDQLIGPRAG